MLINFKNLLGIDLSDFLKGKESRESLHILCKVKAVSLIQSEVNDTAFWMVRLDSEVGMDPKIHFLDNEKANKFYDVMCELLTSGASYAAVDILEHGAQ